MIKKKKEWSECMKIMIKYLDKYFIIIIIIILKTFKISNIGRCKKYVRLSMDKTFAHIGKDTILFGIYRYCEILPRNYNKI